MQPRQQILLLDNFEQVITAAPLLVDLLVDCVDLKIVVTSREVLRVRGEQEFAVPPLILPDLDRLSRRGLQPTTTLSHYAAVALFINRVQAITPNFQPDDDAITAIAQICNRLDGLPLAIELAAARMRLLSPQALLQQLSTSAERSSLHLLTGGPRDLPARQRTLRHAIQWSYDLLEPDEQRLFRQLAVFIGGFTLEAAEAVIRTSLLVLKPPDNAINTYELTLTVFDAITSLVEKSMLKQIDSLANEPRFTMLTTIREFGLEQLKQKGEAQTMQQAHAAYYLELAEQAQHNFTGPKHKVWLERLEEEHHNLEALLRWAVAYNQAETVLSLGSFLWEFWMFHSYMVEMRFWVRHVCQIAEQDLPAAVSEWTKLPKSLVKALTPDLSLRARALVAAGMAAYSPGDFKQATTLFEKSLALSHTGADQKGIADAFVGLGRCNYAQGNLVKAQQLFEESLRLYQTKAVPKGIADALHGLGRVAWSKGDYVAAYAYHEESLAQYNALGRQWDVALAHYVISWVALFQGDFDLAHQRIQQAITLFRAMDSMMGVGIAEVWLGWVLGQQGDDAARPLWRNPWP